MEQRVNFGNDQHVLKLGSTFTSGRNSGTSFHTLKYDFKPASVDLTKVATLDVSTSNQVTVTVPNYDTAIHGQPKTVFKGNQRNYTKECVLIIDKVTGQITLERLHHNIQVKKTRSESSKPSTSGGSNAGSGNGVNNGNNGTGSNNGNMAAASTSAAATNGAAAATGGGSRSHLENSTQRTVSKTRVSTGQRKNTINIMQRHSPLQGSPSYPHHKSPQEAPAWNANNTQSTLPSIPLIGMDDDLIMPTHLSGGNNHSMPDTNSHAHHQQQQQSNSYHQQQHKQPTPPQQQQQQQQHHNAINHPQRTTPNHYQQQQQPQQQQQQHHHQQQPLQQMQHRNTSPLATNHNNQPQQQQQQQQLHNHLPSAKPSDVGVLSSSSSSSDSDSSDSDSDSDADETPVQSTNLNKPGFIGSVASASHHQHGLPALLDEDLRLSESNSSDSD